MSTNEHSSEGPVYTLPGHTTTVLEGKVCDTHPDRPAVKRIQGETDSYGCEYIFMCQECLDEYRSSEPEAGMCDWCHKDAILSPMRDFDEGSFGPVYQVCRECRDKEISYANSEY